MDRSEKWQAFAITPPSTGHLSRSTVSLANYGVDAAFVTKLPSHEIGQAAVNSLRKFGVDTSKIVRGGARVGIYYLEKGASQRPSKVIYDRAGSAFALSKTEEYDWNAIFEGVDWFHFTGITPALGANVAELTEEACKAAKAKGVKISCDLNYRNKLWTKAEARETMTKLMKYVDVPFLIPSIIIFVPTNASSPKPIQLVKLPAYLTTHDEQ